MSDGWTGINIDSVKGELDAFREAANEAQQFYRDAFCLFNYDLKLLWASEKAVEFNSRLLRLGWSTTWVGNEANKILDSATKAAQFMARQNGADFSYSYNPIVGENSYEALEEERNGIRGMNIPLAKVALDTFEENFQKFITMMDNLPMNFSLLDPAGELLATYKRMVNYIVNTIKTEVRWAKDRMKSAFEEESLRITLGKQQAEQQLAA